MSAASHRNLLVGAMAVQLRLIDVGDVAAAIVRWTEDKSRSLEDLLLAENRIDEQTKQLLTSLVDKQIQRHHGSVEDALGTICPPSEPSLSTLCQSLRPIEDADVTDSLNSISDIATESIDPWATNFLDTVPDPAPDDSAAASHRTRYQKLRDHAKGGLGQVYVARDEELNRQVALKQIQARFSGDQGARQRFILEAEITGGLEHPGVVPVYGLGVYEDGQPYYAMRFIRGQSMEAAIASFHQRFSKTGAPAWRDPERTLELRKLLSRVLDVCQAIAYAHSRGVLHRDIKPDNIMLGKYGETLVVDWGLAKVAGLDDVEAEAVDEPHLAPASGSDSAPTRFGSVIGTPGYMSPEQASGQIDAIGPASDVYSLGASLYCLLVGKPPFQSRDADGNPLTITQLLEKVRNGEFTAPRQIDPAIPKPLAAICVRAMAKDPEDRYANPLELADELERWMADEPVTAYRESGLQRLRRWVKRHQTLAAASAAIVLVSVLGLSSFSVVLGKKNIQLAELADSLSTKNQQLDQRGQELQKSNEELRIAEAEATEKAAIATAVTEFLNDDLLAQASPAKNPDPQLQVRTLFEQALQSMQDRFADQPLVKAKLLHTIGIASGYLAQWSESEVALTEALRLRKEFLGPRDVETLETQAALGGVAGSSGKYAKAHTLLTSTLQTQLSELGEEHPDVFETQDSLAGLYSLLGEFDKAHQLNEQSIAGYTKSIGPDAAETLNCLITKVGLLSDAGRFADALQLSSDVHTRAAAALGPLHFTTYDALLSRAQQLYSLGRHDEASNVYTTFMEELVETQGESHPYVAIVRNDLALIDSDHGDPVQGLATLRDLARTSIEKLGPAHRESIMSQFNVGTALNALGRYEESLPVFETVLQAANESLGPVSPSALQTRLLLAEVHWELGDHDSAKPLLEEVIALAKTPMQAEAKVVLDSKTLLAAIYGAAERYDEARELLTAVRAGYTKLGLGKTGVIVYPTENLIDVLVYSDRTKELDELLQQLDDDFGADSVIANQLRLRLAENWIERGEIDRADVSIQQVTQWLAGREPMERSDFGVAYYLGGLMSMLKRSQQAIDVYERLVVRQSEVLGANHVDRLLTLHDLAFEYSEFGQHKESAKLYSEVVRRRTEVYGLESDHTLQSLYNLSMEQFALADHKGTIESMKLLVKAAEARGEPIVNRMELHTGLAHALMKTKDYAAAVPHFQAGVEGMIETYGEADDDTLLLMHQLAYCMDAAAQPEESIAMYRRVVDGRSEVLGAAHGHTLMSLGNMAQVQATAELEQGAEESIADMQRRIESLDVGDVVAIDANYAIAETYRKMNRLDDAITFYRKVADGRRTSLGEEHERTLLAMHQVAYTCSLAGQFDDAIEIYAKVVPGRSKSLGRAHPHTMLSLNNAAKIEMGRGKRAEAAALYEDILNRIVEGKGLRHVDTLMPRMELANLKYQLKEYAMATELYSLSVDVMRKSLATTPNDTTREGFAGVLVMLADAEAHDGQFLAAGRHAREGLEMLEVVAPENWLRYRSLSVIGGLQAADGQHAEAQAALQQAYEGLAASELPRAGILLNQVQIETVDRLLDSYTQTNNAEQVAKWKQVKESLTEQPQP
ncbi:Serine/threonine-protein kinase PknD [Rosistilla carotiformis]|uniref:Serine/threonine-protein kinase PknD n=1 Tax=Rosistilla carotiformis TaxID=2528017 RepID=A0A518JQI3_9BACT|nr:tetratricopeptide repeat protein [Rosistilla carotiformis]QDV67801.1 Serine/threonine-protein kinase PknD [Rosistilla carotiformis]